MWENGKPGAYCWILYFYRGFFLIVELFYQYWFDQQHSLLTKCQTPKVTKECSCHQAVLSNPSAYPYLCQMYYEGRDQDWLRTAPFTFLLSYRATNDFLGFSTLL